MKVNFAKNKFVTSVCSSNTDIYGQICTTNFHEKWKCKILKENFRKKLPKEKYKIISLTSEEKNLIL
jgi:hypothetical protein